MSVVSRFLIAFFTGTTYSSVDFNVFMCVVINYIKRSENGILGHFTSKIKKIGDSGPKL